MRLEVFGENLCALVTASALASSGHQVGLVVRDATLAHDIASGRSGFSEPGLDGLLAEQLGAGRLSVAEHSAQQPLDCAFLAFAPSELERAEAVVVALASSQKHLVIISQSTFPVGTCERLQAVAEASATGAGHIVVSLPDLLQEGAALQGFLRPGHWLLGCDNADAERRVREILRPFNRRRDSVLVMRPREAEFTKFAVTGMLATRLSYMNDLANLADALLVDIEKVRRGLGADPRIGEAYLYPGCGFGGQSFSRDVMRLADSLEQSGSASDLLDEVLAINERQKEVLFRKLWQHYQSDLAGREVALWGVSFKPGVSAIDNAPALRMLDALWAQGVRVRVHDPKAMPTLAEWAGERDDLVLCDDPYQAAAGADALCLLTEWKPYWSPDFKRLKDEMRQPLLLDGRNIYDPEFVRSVGFTYFGVGRQ